MEKQLRSPVVADSSAGGKNRVTFSDDVGQYRICECCEEVARVALKCDTEQCVTGTCIVGFDFFERIRIVVILILSSYVVRH